MRLNESPSELRQQVQGYMYAHTYNLYVCMHAVSVSALSLASCVIYMLDGKHIHLRNVHLLNMQDE